MHPSDEELRTLIRKELEGSDIVWPKYGLDTYDSLTERIVTVVKAGGFHILDDGDYHEMAGTYDL